MKAYLRHIPFLIVLAIVSLVMTREDNATRAGKPKAGEWVTLDMALLLPKGAVIASEDAKPTTLKDYAAGKPMLLNVWATWCTPCIKELPTLKQLNNTYAKKGLKVVTLSVDGIAYGQIKGFVQNKVGITLPHLLQDAHGDVGAELNIKGLPLTFLVNAEGEMTHRFVGATDWMSEKARAPIDALLQTKAKNSAAQK